MRQIIPLYFANEEWKGARPLSLDARSDNKALERFDLNGTCERELAKEGDSERLGDHQ
jgi:hypothetical protein